MKYNLLIIGDIHFGAMEVEDAISNLQLLIDFIECHKNIDIVVLNGDYFDTRLQLNSKIALSAIKWFDLLYQTCIENNVKAIRIVKGTHDHDNNQLEVFRTSTYPEPYVKIINTCTVDESIPGLNILYCPDETINASEYYDIYASEFSKRIDIGVFHGSFDNILPQIAKDNIMDNNLPTIVFEYDYLSSIINGPLISSHWHEYTELGALTYIGSFDRWMFGEESDKGFMFLSYDTSNNKYYQKMIINKNAKIYKTINISNDQYKSTDDFQDLYTLVKDLISDNPDIKIRIVYNIITESEEAEVNFSTFRSTTSSIKNLKITVKDIIKKKQKKEKTENFIKDIGKYNYVFDNSKDLSDKIKLYLESDKGIYLSKEDILERISKYM